MTREEKAVELFRSGYNCSQALMVTFLDLTGLDESTAAKLSSSFGGGMGRMREVCGAVSGMLMVAGLLYGYDTPGDDVSKRKHYSLVQELAAKFREEAGSIVCREILKNPPSDPNPTPRTDDFYRKRPCARMIGMAARILEAYIDSHPLEDSQ